MRGQERGHDLEGLPESRPNGLKPKPAQRGFLELVHLHRRERSPFFDFGLLYDLPAASASAAQQDASVAQAAQVLEPLFPTSRPRKSSTASALTAVTTGMTPWPFLRKS